MPDKIEFVVPHLQELTSEENLLQWARELILALTNALTDIQNFKMSYTGTFRVVNQDVAAGFTIDSDGHLIIVASSGAVTSDATTAIADGKVVGESIRILNGTVNTVTIKDNANTKLGADVILGPNDSLLFYWNGSNWICLGYRDN